MKTRLLLFVSFFAISALVLNAQNLTSKTKDSPSNIEKKGILEEIHIMEARRAFQKISFKGNSNTENYELIYHRLKFELDPSSNFLAGEVTTHFEAKESLDEIIFDLVDNMTVSSVTQRSNNLSFSQNTSDELIIQLPQQQNIGVLDSLTIVYSGQPTSSGYGSYTRSSHNGNPIIWTLSEPFGAKGWWPCKQDLIDKADSIDVYITTPKLNSLGNENIAVSNGLELSQTTNGSNKTTHYKHKYPIPAYLVAIAVTNYEIYSETVANNGNPFEIVNYVYPENLSAAQSSTAITVDIMDLFIDLFEPYPFENEKYGHAQCGFGGGMEHSTVSFMGGFPRGLIAHELAHQWFGDKITCGSWNDIWLNEGFATYLSGLVIENFDDEDDFINWKSETISSITSLPDGAVYLTDDESTNESNIFSSRLSYSKGAMVIHMLRKKLGDDLFFQAIKDYLSDPVLSYGYAKSADFISIVENSANVDLTEFFNDWLYNEGYPSYSLVWENLSANQIKINISQTQSHNSVSFFESPIKLKLLGDLGLETEIILDNNSNDQEFIEEVPFEVVQVLFDPENDIISRGNSVEGNSSFASQIIISPNPAENIVSIDLPFHFILEKVIIYNSIGLEIESFDTTSFDISNISSGIYFIKIQTDKGPFYKKLLVK